MFVCDDFCNCNDDCLQLFDTFDRSNVSQLWNQVSGQWRIVDSDWLTCDSTSGEIRLNLTAAEVTDGNGYRWSVWVYGEEGATLGVGKHDSGSVNPWTVGLTVTFGSNLLELYVGTLDSCTMTKVMPAEQWVELSFCHFERQASGGRNNAMFYVDGEQVWGTGITRNISGPFKFATTGEVYIDDLYYWDDDYTTECTECDYCWYFFDKFKNMNFRLTVSGHINPAINGEFLLTRKISSTPLFRPPCDVFWSDATWTLEENLGSLKLSGPSNFSFENSCGHCEVEFYANNGTGSQTAHFVIKCVGSGGGTGGQADIAMVANQSSSGGAGLGGTAFEELVPSGLGGAD